VAMKILVTNDDGIYSPGLLALAQAATAIGEVHIFAPHAEQSSMGHAITHARPLAVSRTKIAGFEAWRVDGTPADCVTLGSSQLGGADLVLSGINLGLNLGNSMWHSGTLAGAKQAALLGIPGAALSVPVPDDEKRLFTLRAVLLEVFDEIVGSDLRLVNVNLPFEPRGIRFTRQSVRHYDGAVVAGEHPRGRPIYWIVANPIEDVDEDTDRFAVQSGYVSITPLRLDLTDHAALTRAKADPRGETSRRGLTPS
jgi:5'-nucleotidase